MYFNYIITQKKKDNWLFFSNNSHFFSKSTLFIRNAGEGGFLTSGRTRLLPAKTDKST